MVLQRRAQPGAGFLIPRSGESEAGTRGPEDKGTGRQGAGGGHITRHLLIWDGDCYICRRWAEWVISQDRRHLFRAAPYQEVPSPPMTPHLYRACSLAVHVLTADGQVLRAGRAGLFILAELGWPVRWLDRRPWIWLVEWAYCFVANHRSFFAWLPNR